MPWGAIMPDAVGLIQVYTGDGKGKTTAALGQALRAVGQGFRVGFIQFLKGEKTGESLFVAQNHPFEIFRLGKGSQFNRAPEELMEETRQTLKIAREWMLSGRYDLLVLDEIFSAVKKGMISSAEILDLMREKPPALELVLTGRHAPPEIMEKADLVTEMKLVKHPFQKGVASRAGVEF